MSIVNDKPTPETDAAQHEGLLRTNPIPMQVVTANFARKLERERDEAREVASGLAIQEERVNEAQKELSSIHRWIDKNHADGFIDSLTYLQNLERVTDSWYDRIDGIEADARRFVRERDKAREDLESEKNTRNAIIEKGLKLEKQLREMQEALEYIANAGLSARHIEDYAKEFLSKK